MNECGETYQRSEEHGMGDEGMPKMGASFSVLSKCCFDPDSLS